MTLECFSSMILFHTSEMLCVPLFMEQPPDKHFKYHHHNHCHHPPHHHNHYHNHHLIVIFFVCLCKYVTFHCNNLTNDLEEK